MKGHDDPTIHLRAAGQGRLAGSVAVWWWAGLRFGKRWAFEGLVAPAVVLAIFGALSLA